jgi:hypothetical protein
MNQPIDPSKATLDHVPDTTGRDGAIDFAAKVRHPMRSESFSITARISLPMPIQRSVR